MYVAACIAIISFLLDSSEVFSVPQATIKLLYLLSACGIPIVILLPWYISRKKAIFKTNVSGDGELNTTSDKLYLQEKSILINSQVFGWF